MVPILPFIVLLLLHTAPTSARTYKFALCPKFVNSTYFDVARDGCVDRAEVITAANNDNDVVECLYVGPAVNGEFGDLQAAVILKALEENPDIDGLSISVAQADSLAPVYEAARQMGIPLVTFDCDEPESGRIAYIGTDNKFMGSQISKVLQKLEPLGGSYAILKSEAHNLEERALGMQSILEEDPVWSEQVVVSYQGNNTAGLSLMRETLEQYPNLDAFLVVNGVAMFEDGWPDLVIDYPNTTFITGDDSDFQLDYLKVTKVHGLVGQIPYEMGSLSVDTLLTLAKNPNQRIPNFIGTNVLEHLVVPLKLRPLTVNENRLPIWSIVVGSILLLTVYTAAVLFCGWTLLNRKVRVIQYAQPYFLIMVAVGCVIMSASLIPLSLEKANTVGSSAICMATPWLLFLGFTTTFSALFAKTWRINKLITASRSFQRITLSSMDVLKPFFLLLVANVAVLTAWTVVDPLTYVRNDSQGTDEWNRVIGTYGICQTQESVSSFVIPLAILNIGLLFVANYQAYKARNLDSEFAESNYIAIAMASFLQAAVVGAPVLVLVRDNPLAWYLTCCFMIFFVSFGILCLLFIPKIQSTRNPIEEPPCSWDGGANFSSRSLRSRPFGGGNLAVVVSDVPGFQISGVPEREGQQPEDGSAQDAATNSVSISCDPQMIDNS